MMTLHDVAAKYDPTVPSHGQWSDNPLLRMLYDACVRHAAHDAPIRKCTITESCSELRKWYLTKYGDAKKGSRGQKRGTSGVYRFDLVYNDERTFEKYLETHFPSAPSSELLAFVLHTAVAFMVSPEALDRALRELNFHPLHVKNPHHLAIYTVLSSGRNPNDADFDPFFEVSRLYRRANELLHASNAEHPPKIFVGTREMRESLFQRGGLNETNFEQVILRNSANINARHSLIWKDFELLFAVFSNLFDTADDLSGFSARDTEYYSFYAFFSRCCHKGLSRDKFREMPSMMRREGKHPTRNVMVLLWLYAYCFRFVDEVAIDNRAAFLRRLNKAVPDRTTQAAACCTDKIYGFDVARYLFGDDIERHPMRFDGAALITDLNDKLTNRYGWGPLNGKVPFDASIRMIAELRLDLSAKGRPLRGVYHANALDASELGAVTPEFVPAPLAIATQLFELTEEKVQSKHPLRCAFYEQL